MTTCRCMLRLEFDEVDGLDPSMGSDSAGWQGPGVDQGDDCRPRETEDLGSLAGRQDVRGRSQFQMLARRCQPDDV